MTRTYRNFEVIGPPSVVADPDVFRRLADEDFYLILLMGPTGSGKSSFIECLGNDKTLGIAKDQLDGFTQTLTVYRLNNVQEKESPESPNMCFIDMPGFADSKLPESKMLRTLVDWMKTYDFKISRILYFDRITDPRMVGSKGKLLDLFKEMTGQETGKSIVIVTTMWDQLWKEEQISRANQRLEEMRTVYYKNFVQDGTQILKFENTHESALSVIDECLTPQKTKLFAFERTLFIWEPSMLDSSIGHHLHMNLLNRKDSLLQRLTVVDSNILEEAMYPHAELKARLLKQRTEALADLAVVEEELKAFSGSHQQPDAKTDGPTSGLVGSLASEAPRASSSSLRSDKFKGFVDRKTQKVKDLFRHK